MATLGSMLSKSVKQQMRQACHVAYCEHTKKAGTRCSHHCRPSAEWIAHQKALSSITPKKEKDSLDRLVELLFVDKEA